MEEFTLRPRPPYNFKETLWFLDRNLDDCMHTVSGGSVLKALRTPKGAVLMSITASQNEVNVQILKGPAGCGKEIIPFVSEWFDLERDIRPFYGLLGKDNEFAFLGTKYEGFKIVGIPDLFECLVWCIAGQQINLTFAYTLKRRLVEKWGDKMMHNGKTHYLFPYPETLAAVPADEFRKMQFTTRKAEYIIGIAQAFAEKRLSKEKLLAMGSEEKMLSYLLSFRGIGQWTGNYALMKSVSAMNRFPLGDAGVNQALLKYKGIERGNTKDVDRILSSFEGWKTYLVFYLWRCLREMA